MDNRIQTEYPVDAFGRELWTGDSVAVILKVFSHQKLERGTVTGFTNKKVRLTVQDSGNPFRPPYSVLKSSDQIMITGPLYYEFGVRIYDGSDRIRVQ